MNAVKNTKRRPDLVRDTRRFEAYYRWSLYSFTLVQLFFFAGALAASGSAGAFPATWTFLASMLLGVAHVPLQVLVGRSAFNAIRTPAPTPRPLLVAWGLVGLASSAFSMPWETPLTPWTMTVNVIVVTSLAMLTPRMSWRTLLAVSGAFIVVNAIEACVLFLLFGEATGIAVAVWWTMGGIIMLMTAWSFAWVVRVLLQLEQARESQARLAVADERLRISRDLHDTFGRTLATISVKSTLAGELVRRDRATDAAKELDEIRDIADRAGKEVRAIVRGEAEVGLGQEFIGARALLASAGIHTTVVGEPDTVPQELGAALAWIVREGVTNILRHSHATQASLSINVEGGLLTLLLANDGARRDMSGSQTGIAGMRERVKPFAGTVTATRDAEWFTLEVTAHATKGVSA